MTGSEIPARYVCKKCGAESPAGIGYVAGPEGNHRLSMGVRPDPTCPGPHLLTTSKPWWADRVRATGTAVWTAEDGWV